MRKKRKEGGSEEDKRDKESEKGQFGIGRNMGVREEKRERHKDGKKARAREGGGEKDSEEGVRGKELKRKGEETKWRKRGREDRET